MEPTHDPVPEGESAERLEQEESVRYPGHGDPDSLRERVGLDRPRDPDPPLPESRNAD
jgi:hypothetical protein